jgi:hypothetical protein
MTSLTIHDVDTELILKLKDAAAMFHENTNGNRYYLYCKIEVNDVDIQFFSPFYKEPLDNNYNIKQIYNEDS